MTMRSLTSLKSEEVEGKASWLGLARFLDPWPIEVSYELLVA